jgi:MoaA/NifB/PqqE/SkfB family radical SAM enzyme
MLNYKNIRRVHLEISTRCNAACPECPRNLHGVDGIVSDYPICELNLEQVKKIFEPEFVKQLEQILINGNYGDFITCKDGLKIVEYFRSHNENLIIQISTNASGQTKIWERLAELKVRVFFRIDGLEDTHSLYRQDTNWDLIISNAEKFVSAGGHAEWWMIDFDFNQHQRDEALMLSIKKGFKNFELVDNGRNNTVAFSRDGKYRHTIGDSTQSKEIFHYYQTYKNILKRDNSTIYQSQEHKPIYCHAKNKKEIYVAANGEVSPCCWTGFYPQTNKRLLGNDQLLEILKVNSNSNALEVGLQSAIDWFGAIERTWKIQDVSHGRLYICNSTCGNTVDNKPPERLI